MRKKHKDPSSHAFDGRNLVSAYFAAYGYWREASAAVSALPDGAPYEVYLPLQERGDDACMIARLCEEALLEFVVKASGRKPLEPPGDAIELDTWPAAAVLLDGRLWVAYQPQNSEAGELQLCHTVLADAVRLPDERGGR